MSVEAGVNSGGGGGKKSAEVENEDAVKAGVEIRDKLRKEWNKGSRGPTARNMDLIGQYLEEAKVSWTFEYSIGHQEQQQLSRTYN
jgi:hypothetical protein